jgi:hypothetical protein
MGKAGPKNPRSFRLRSSAIPFQKHLRFTSLVWKQTFFDMQPNSAVKEILA